MGVTKNERNIFQPDNIYDLEDLEIDIEQEIDNNDNNDMQKQLRKKGRKVRSSCGRYGSLDNLALKKKGTKTARRKENLKYLMSLFEKDDDTQLELEVFEPSVSAFAELFMEQEKMKIWNEFVNCSEDEQYNILQGKQSKFLGEKETIIECAEDENSNPDDDTESWEEILDKRSVHPSFSAKESFKRIDKKIKSVLIRRHFPMGILHKLEEDLTSFFCEWPTSLYVSHACSSYERMILHAVCQYMNLQSHSFDDGTCRQTHVENQHSTFNKPSVSLSQYLQSLSIQQ